MIAPFTDGLWKYTEMYALEDYKKNKLSIKRPVTAAAALANTTNNDTLNTRIRKE